MRVNFPANLTFAAAIALGAAGAACAAEPYVNATVGGVLAPGVYGRIEIGTNPPPPVLYPQPVIITRPAVAVAPQPLYLYVPPGHAKKWSKHCAKYNACGQPVYFVKVDERGSKKGRDRDHEEHGHGKKGRD